MKLNKKVDHFIKIYLETIDGHITIFLVENTCFVEAKSYKTVIYINQQDAQNSCD